MSGFVSKEKMSRKDRKKLAAEKRIVWDFSPATKRIESKKVYNRKRISRAKYEDGTGVFLCNLDC